MIEAAPEVRGNGVHHGAHIREIGAHEHRWQNIGTDGTGEIYRECHICGTRTVVSGNFHGAQRQDWLGGASWERSAEPLAEPPAEGEDLKFSRRRGRPPAEAVDTTAVPPPADTTQSSS